tara:strand:+ start:21 stop:1451 length:1431 start_codon:yes stop_codon:yes gene_type:complete
MGTGYTRNDTSNNIANGNVIDAADLDGEFDAIATAFGTSGHSHDGTTAEGGAIVVVGPTQEFLGDGSSFYPKTDATYDLGKSTASFDVAYVENINLAGTGITATGAELNYTDGVTSNIQTQLGTKLPLAGGTMTGAIDMGSNNITTTGKVLFANMYSTEGDLPSATTYHGMFAHVHATGAGYFAHGGSWVKLANDSQISDENFTTADHSKLDGIETGATADQTKADIDALNVDADTLDGQHGSYYTTYSDTAVSNLVASSPAALDTLNELAAALGDDPNFATTITNALAGKVDDSQVLTNVPSGAVFTDTNTTYSVGDGGLTEHNFTTDDHNKLNGIASGATNVTNNNQLTNGAGYTTNVGDITNVTAGTNLTGGGSSGSLTVNLTASPNITSLNVGGTEVVSSSRALKNIASVDATTAASITAAGVSGSATSFQVLSTAPSSPSAGDLYYNPGVERLYIHDGTDWVSLSVASAAP